MNKIKSNVDLYLKKKELEMCKVCQIFKVKKKKRGLENEPRESG